MIYLYTLTQFRILIKKQQILDLSTLKFCFVPPLLISIFLNANQTI